MLAVFGLLGIAFSVAFACYLLTRFLVSGTGVPGFTTLALLLAGLTGFSFFAYGVIGEYLIRILNSTATTPPYVVRDEVGAELSRAEQRDRHPFRQTAPAPEKPEEHWGASG